MNKPTKEILSSLFDEVCEKLMKLDLDKITEIYYNATKFSELLNE